MKVPEEGGTSNLKIASSRRFSSGGILMVLTRIVTLDPLEKGVKFNEVFGSKTRHF